MDPILIDVEQSKITADGWHLSVSLTDMTINSVPNMAATAFTREGCVTGTATLTIDGSSDHIVTSGALRVWALLGCEDQPSNVVLGSSPVGRTVNTTVSPAGTAGISESPDEASAPRTQVTTLPGGITEIILGYKPLGPLPKHGEKQFMVSFRKFYVGVGSCRGPVFIRLHARAWMSTDHSDDTVDVYSDVVPLSPLNAPRAEASSDERGLERGGLERGGDEDDGQQYPCYQYASGQHPGGG